MSNDREQLMSPSPQRWRTETDQERDGEELQKEKDRPGFWPLVLFPVSKATAVYAY